MCRYCEEVLYFDKDEDKHVLLNYMVCPVCGKLTKYGIDTYGDSDTALRVIIGNNCDGIGTNAYLSILSRLKEDTLELKEKFLKANGLSFKNNSIICDNCGKVLIELSSTRTLSNISITELINTMEHSEINFCTKCGTKVLKITNKDFVKTLVEKPIEELNI